MNVDIVIIQKKTNAIVHQQTRKILLDCLDSHALTYEILTLDDIREKNIPYFDPTQQMSPFSPHKRLVIALGGDGTLLHASHYVGGEVRLLGVNSAPTTSKGYLCVLKPDEIVQNLPALITDANKYKHIKRLKISFDRMLVPFKHSVPLCLNDALVCHQHPAATTRSVISLLNLQSGEVEFSQMIYSSGIWISTVAGQTAAVSSYGFTKENEEADVIFVAIREPYFPKNEKKYPSTFSFRSIEKQLSIVSKVSSGLICVDGHDSCIHFGMGDAITFSTPQECVLKLVL